MEFVLLGPLHDRRQLQDSPILGDVWLAFAHAPERAHELLVVPHREVPASAVAITIDERVARSPFEEDADIAPLHGVVAARLHLLEVLTVVVPMTVWWRSERIQRQLQAYLEHEHKHARSEQPSDTDRTHASRLNRIASAIKTLAQDWTTGFEGALDEDLFPALDRFLALAGLLLWAGGANTRRPLVERDRTGRELRDVKAQEIVSIVVDLLHDLLYRSEQPLVWQLSLNRRALPAMNRSVPSVKADAARRLFGVNCSEIAWAVIDSGIQGDHPAFLDAGGSASRVRASFDFSQIRSIVSLGNLRASSARDTRVNQLLQSGLLNPPSHAEAIRLLAALANNVRERRPTDWELVRPLVEIAPATRPQGGDHGTHVAGIIGASAGTAPETGGSEHGSTDGMCPDIQLYDFRVLGPAVRETEFAIIAALQFIRHLNGRTDHTTVHGANLSLSIPHDVRNYACGRTPICLECERLVESGVMVVAAAGNLGYQSFETRDGSYEGYAAFSITDPGNAESVLTVGATHRYAPHTYGVSFFSSRGPTGDGRAKPDLVAPGERIHGPLRSGWGDLDGTSMAAPHASGAAAMLMARYSELIGQPRRIKTILCQSATDLGRERSFQGNGMLDVLRAFQSI